MTVHGDIRDVLEALPHHPWADHANGDHYVSSDIFPTKWEVLRREVPDARSVFEFGALVGYFLVTALDACPKIERVAWVDVEIAHPDSNDLCAANVVAASKGRKPFPRSRWFDKTHPHVLAHLLYTDGEARPAQYDVVHVDGDHSYKGCLIDLTLGLAMNPQLLLVDDYQAIGEVRAATDDFAQHMGLTVEAFETVNGLAVIRP